MGATPSLARHEIPIFTISTCSRPSFKPMGSERTRLSNFEQQPLLPLGHTVDMKVIILHFVVVTVVGMKYSGYAGVVTLAILRGVSSCLQVSSAFFCASR